MSASPPLFVELCAGTAALSLRLQARHARPPVSRMGAKTGYADAILAVMGLRPGQRAGHYLWCEPDPGCRLLLEAYRDRELAQAAADIIRGWKDEEPRALWERLRAEGPVKEGGGAREVARTIQILASNELINLDTTTWRNTGAGGSTFGGSVGYGADRSPRKLDGLPLCSATIAPDARTVDPREVARWAFIQRRSAHGKGDGYHSGNDTHKIESDAPAGAFDRLPAIPATITPDARDVDPVPPLPPGTVVFIDPPYSDVAPVIPPMLAAERLPSGAVGRAEGEAALLATGFVVEGLPLLHQLRVRLLEVLAATGTQGQVLDSVVERVVVDVVDDLLWSQWAAKMALHHEPVFKDVASIVTHHSIPTLKPPLALACAADGCEALDLWSHLRDFALGCEALPGAAAKFSKAVAWTDGARLAHRADLHRSADLAGDLERHCRLRAEVRQDTNTRIARPGRKTTGYAADLPRSEVVRLAQLWSEAGARVYISEAEPLAELDGWHRVEITATRRGQKRTFSRQQAEWLTCSHPPVWTPAVQGDLFGGGS